MALTGALLLELALYASSFVCGIVTAVYLAVVQGEFGGRCMLYGLVTYNAQADVIGVQSSSAASLCHFVTAISVMVAVVCFSLTLYLVYNLCIERVVTRERLGMNVIVAASGIFLFFLLITGCMLKIGRDSLCSSIMQHVHNITSCEQAQDKTWVSPLTGKWFYSRLHKAETAVWVNFFFWLIIGVIMIIQRRQNTGSKFPEGASGGLFGGGPAATSEETAPIFGGPSSVPSQPWE
ncbi:transmembrane protein 179B [Betta splendens]|uniref:Transmembrane protein 179B n=1 Tax=Betta splendens TaxID=158456 RepID=A0A6P7PFZ4_BETSP|nr:transmembrane protein 179B [Betta splendens]